MRRSIERSFGTLPAYAEPDDFSHAARYACSQGDMWATTGRWLVSVSNLGVMMGKPVIAGTGITVELILEKPAAGETVERILDAHPRLNEDAVRAALAFAAGALRADVVYPLETLPR
jgi:uncharacterized protein (DUF433 family)